LNKKELADNAMLRGHVASAPMDSQCCIETAT